MKIAVITGASSGMGKEFARQFEDKKVDEIWVIARREEKLKKLQEELTTPVRVYAFDLLKESSFDIFAHILFQENPDIRYLVNAAGFGVFGKSDMSLSLVSDMIDLNIKALVNMTYLCLPYMNEGSRILQLSSASSFTPLENFNIYASTKAFVTHFSFALYKEVKSRGIKVTVVCPGWVKTEFFKHANYKKAPIGPRFCRPMYRAKKVVHTAISDSEKGKLMSLTGNFTKMHFALSKILPKKVMMSLWGLLQKAE